MRAPDDFKATRVVIALALLVLTGGVGLFVQSSCTPSGATRVPHEVEPVQADTDEPDPAAVDLLPDTRYRPPAAT